MVKLGMLKPTYPCFQTLLFTTYLVSSHIAAFVDIIRGVYRFWLDIIDLDSKQVNQKIGLKSKSENIFSAAHCKYLKMHNTLHWWEMKHYNQRLMIFELLNQKIGYNFVHGCLCTAVTRCTDYCQTIAITMVYQSSFLKKILIHMLQWKSKVGHRFSKRMARTPNCDSIGNVTLI